MEIEKIKTLIFSNNLADKRLGVEFLAKKGKGAIKIFMELGAKKSNKYEDNPYSYVLKYPEGGIVTTGDLCDVYVVKNYYYYEISTEGLYIDTPKIGERRIKEGEPELLKEL